MKFVDIKTGGLCNNRCVHCVVARQDRIGTRGTQSYKRSISAAVRNGATSISVTGGEPTLHEGIVAILSHAKAKGLSVTLQTNGRYLEKKEFARELEDLVDQYVIALHGSKSKVHDAITRRKGSFRQTVAGVKNISNGRARVVAKVVLTALNLKDLMKLADLVVELQMDVAVFTFVHGVGEAKRNYDKLVVPYKTLWPPLRACIDKLDKHQEMVSIETFPFCIVHGYEHKVIECFFRECESEVQFLDKRRTSWIPLRIRQKRKFEKCVDCSFDPLCEGVWREYYDKFGADEFVPRHDTHVYQMFVEDLETIFGAG